jgi:hypothetical protein
VELLVWYNIPDILRMTRWVGHALEYTAHKRSALIMIIENLNERNHWEVLDINSYIKSN